MTTSCVVFRGCVRVVDVCPVEAQWTFHVLNDETLQVEVQMPAAAEGGDSGAVESAYSFLCFDGVAAPLPAPSGQVSTISTYSCSFYLAKCGDEAESWTVRFEGTLSPTTGYSGHWVHDSQQGYRLWRDDLDDGERHAVPAAGQWTASIEQFELVLSPLTCGTYLLEGSLRDEDNEGFIVPLAMEIELLGDGSVAGADITVGGVADSNEGSNVQLTGSWTRGSLDIVRVLDGSDEGFAFHGTVGRYALQGVWAMVDLLEPVEWGDSERQPFHLRPTKMRRPWSPTDHQWFPPSFHAAVRVCLLSSVRDDGCCIPSELWPRVFEFCCFLWFEPPALSC